MKIYILLAWVASLFVVSPVVAQQRAGACASMRTISGTSFFYNQCEGPVYWHLQCTLLAAAERRCAGTGAVFVAPGGTEKRDFSSGSWDLFGPFVAR
jgi:hypothetical protein